MATKKQSAPTSERRASVAWKYSGSLEDFADFKFEAIHNFIDAYFAEMELWEKRPEKVTAAMLDAADETTGKALDRLIEAEFAWRSAVRREDSPPAAPPPNFCIDCGKDTTPRTGKHEWYTVRDAVWRAARMKKATLKPGCGGGILCIGCLEKRLGRMLAPRDFTAAPINDPDGPGHTPRLASRLQGRQ